MWQASRLRRADLTLSGSRASIGAPASWLEGKEKPLLPSSLDRHVRSGSCRPSETADMNRAAVSRFDLVNSRDHLGVNVQSSRGRQFTCEFCDVIKPFGRRPRTKDVGQIPTELQRLRSAPCWPRFGMPDLGRQSAHSATADRAAPLAPAGARHERSMATLNRSPQLTRPEEGPADDCMSPCGNNQSAAARSASLSPLGESESPLGDNTGPGEAGELSRNNASIKPKMAWQHAGRPCCYLTPTLCNGKRYSSLLDCRVQ
jgi:hypothetical protein